MIGVNGILIPIEQYERKARPAPRSPSDRERPINSVLHDLRSIVYGLTIHPIVTLPYCQANICGKRFD